MTPIEKISALVLCLKEAEQNERFIIADFLDGTRKILWCDFMGVGYLYHGIDKYSSIIEFTFEDALEIEIIMEDINVFD